MSIYVKKKTCTRVVFRFVYGCVVQTRHIFESSYSIVARRIFSQQKRGCPNSTVNEFGNEGTPGFSSVHIFVLNTNVDRQIFIYVIINLLDSTFKKSHVECQ